jgi:polyphosphate kinase
MLEEKTGNGMLKTVKTYIDREISWLSFNARVLQEATDPSNPLLERIKFIGIFSSNLDEFFRVRVGTLMRMVQANIRAKEFIGSSPKKILDQIHDIVVQQRHEFERVFRKVIDELESENIHIINEQELDAGQRKHVMDYFTRDVRPRLAPIMLDQHRNFPYLKNQIVYLAIRMYNSQKPGQIRFAIIEAPSDALPRFLVLPRKEDKNYVIMLDDVIRCGLKDIFAIFQVDVLEAYTIKLTRDAEIELDDDVTKSFFEKVSRSLKQRQTGQPVRFVYDKEMPDDLLKFILKKNNLIKFSNVIPGGRYHNARDFMSFPNIGHRGLRYRALPPIKHDFIVHETSLLDAIQKKDLLFHYPYHSFNHFLDLLRESAIDPDVQSIRITLYRLASNSNVINALINAIKNGKQVTVIMELQARFDEEANIFWMQQLRDAGAHVMDGVPGLKVHSKLCLITRLENGRKKRYASIGTGNFNESTARVYSDHTLFTADKRITDEVKKVFDFFRNNYISSIYKHLLVAPFQMRRTLLKLIKIETDNARNGKPAGIDIKLNNLVDMELIGKLYQASVAGVKIRIIARSVCSLIPGLKGPSANIEAVSIVDKYLEHSRLFIFTNGGNEKYYFSSGDWMIRNLDNRVEVAVPVYDADLQKELKTFFELQWRDNCKARDLKNPEKNEVRKLHGDQVFRAQDDIYLFLKKQHHDLSPIPDQN